MLQASHLQATSCAFRNVHSSFCTDAFCCAKRALFLLRAMEQYDTLAGLARGGTAQDVAGVGVEMVYADAKGDEPMVNSVVPGSPAEAAGVKANDIIIAVDGDSTKGRSLDAVAAELRGSVGSNVRVTLKRGGKTVDLTAKRAEIKFQVCAVLLSV
jgi:C-terminal processing protease CtpA/Prc